MFGRSQCRYRHRTVVVMEARSGRCSGAAAGCDGGVDRVRDVAGFACSGRDAVVELRGGPWRRTALSSVSMLQILSVRWRPQLSAPRVRCGGLPGADGERSISMSAHNASPRRRPWWLAANLDDGSPVSRAQIHWPPTAESRPRSWAWPHKVEPGAKS